MPKLVIADTSCFIVLTKTDKLELLKKLYQKIYTTREVANEFGDKLPSWVELAEIQNHTTQRLIEIQVDKGEASTIALALETENSLLILDDYKARKLVDILGLKYTGTIGIIIKAKQVGHIKSIKPFLEKLCSTHKCETFFS